MKKVMFLALSLLMMTGASTFAQSVVKSTKDSTSVTTSTTNASPVKTEIKASELPQAVLETLKGDSYKASTVSTAYAVKVDGVKIAYYVVNLKSSTGTFDTVSIDGDGKIVK